MSGGSVWIVLPVKALSDAKQRLAPVLPPPARRELVLAMLETVLGTLAAAAPDLPVLAVTPDPDVARMAEDRGGRVLREQRASGLNAAVRAGLALAGSEGASHALVLPADVPLMTPEEVRCLLGRTAAASPCAALVPAADGDGTNAMLLGPPDALDASFGPGSYVRHLSQAVARRLDVQVLHLDGLAADIDRPADLYRLLGPASGLARFQFLAHFMGAAGCDRPLPPKAGGP